MLTGQNASLTTAFPGTTIGQQLQQVEFAGRQSLLRTIGIDQYSLVEVQHPPALDARRPWRMLEDIEDGLADAVKLSRLAGTIVFILVFVPTLIAALKVL